MRRFLAIATLLLAGCAGPARFEAIAWEPPAGPAQAGPLAPTRDLERATFHAKGQVTMPEDCVSDERGSLYAGTGDGRIVKITGDSVETFATTGGTPLGLKFDGSGSLLACVVGRGLVAIGQSGAFVTLASGMGERKFRFINDVDVGPDGTIWFTESHPEHGPEGAGAVWAIAENRPEGRLYSLDPKTGLVRERLAGLSFANGCTVLPDGRSILIAETARYRVRRLWLAGPKAGQDEIFAQLPGIPDGLMADGQGRVWIALVPRDPLLDMLAPHPWLRGLVMKLPESVLTGMASGHSLGWIVAYSEAGQPLLSWQDNTGRFMGGIANVSPAHGQLCFGTKWGDWVATLPLPDAPKKP